MKIERHQNDLILLDEAGTTISILSKEQAVDMAQALLDKAGQIVDQPEEAI